MIRKGTGKTCTKRKKKIGYLKKIVIGMKKSFLNYREEKGKSCIVVYLPTPTYLATYRHTINS